MYVAKTKALISFAVTAKLICVFVFAYAKCWFSHDAVHIEEQSDRGISLPVSLFWRLFSNIRLICSNFREFYSNIFGVHKLSTFRDTIIHCYNK